MKMSRAAGLWVLALIMVTGLMLADGCTVEEANQCTSASGVMEDNFDRDCDNVASVSEAFKSCVDDVLDDCDDKTANPVNTAVAHVRTTLVMYESTCSSAANAASCLTDVNTCVSVTARTLTELSTGMPKDFCKGIPEPIRLFQYCAINALEECDEDTKPLAQTTVDSMWTAIDPYQQTCDINYGCSTVGLTKCFMDFFAAAGIDPSEQETSPEPGAESEKNPMMGYFTDRTLLCGGKVDTGKLVKCVETSIEDLTEECPEISEKEGDALEGQDMQPDKAQMMSKFVNSVCDEDCKDIDEQMKEVENCGSDKERLSGVQTKVAAVQEDKEKGESTETSCTEFHEAFSCFTEAAGKCSATDIFLDAYVLMNQVPNGKEVREHCTDSGSVRTGPYTGSLIAGMMLVAVLVLA